MMISDGDGVDTNHTDTSGTDGAPDGERIFLVVLDETKEMQLALRFASRRAKATHGRVALFAAIEPSDFGHWKAVDDLIEDEQRAEVESKVRKFADQVTNLSEKMPILFIRTGNARDSLLDLIAEEPRISVLVLAAGTTGKGPGPLVTALTGKFYSRVHIPITIVPGHLSEAEIDALT